ncbi:MAG: translocation/assembly module TamB domain-containing protein [Endomicrobiales bacterium]|nr:translocation/assembly module TamB domain-containing protein [Endomicrobiales bacterium]
MRKKTLFLLLLLPLVLAIILFLAIRLKFIEVPVTYALENYLGNSVKISSVEYKPLNRLSINDLQVGNFFSCKKVYLFLNPIKLIFSKDKLSAIAFIHLSSPQLNYTPEFDALVKKLSSSKVQNNNMADISLSFEDGSVLYRGTQIKNLKGKLYLKQQEISAKLSLDIKGFSINANFLKAAQNTFDLDIQAKSDNASVLLASHGEVTKDGLNARLNLPLIKISDFELKDSSGMFVFSNSNGLSFNLISASSMSMNLSGENIKNLNLIFFLNLAGLNTQSSGKVDFAGWIKDGVFTFDGSTKDVRINKAHISDLVCRIESGKNGNIAQCNISVPDKKLTFISELSTSAYFSARLINNGKLSADVISTTGVVNFNIYDINLSALPLYFDGYENPCGVLVASGSYSAGNGFVYGLLNSASVNASEPLSFNFSSIKNANTILFSLLSANNELAFNYSHNANGDIYNGKFKKISIKKLLPIFVKSLSNLSGYLSGSFECEQDKAKAQLYVGGLNTASSGFDSAKILAEINHKELDVKELALSLNNKKVLEMNFAANLKKKKENFNLVSKISGFKINNFVLNTKLATKGNLDIDAKTFRGSVLAKDLLLNGFKKTEFKSEIVLSTAALKLNDFLFKGYARGSFKYDLIENKVEANTQFTFLPLNLLQKDLQGALSGTASVFGSVKNPIVSAKFQTVSARYKNLSYASSGLANYQNGVLFLKDAKLTAKDTQLNFSGSFSKDINLDAWFNLSSISALRSIGLYIPSDCNGKFNGELKVEGSTSSYMLSGNLYGKDVAFGKIKLNELNSEFKFNKGVLYIDALLAKIADSEFSLLEGSKYNINTGKINIVSKLNNLHLGPIDLFGNMVVDGALVVKSSKPVEFVGSVSTKDLWLNQCKLENSKFAFNLQNNKVRFSEVANSPLNIDGSIDFSIPESYAFKALSISWNKQKYASLNGIFSLKNRSEIALSMRSVDAEAISELFNSPLRFSGLLDTNILFNGTLEKPTLEGSINLFNGVVAAIPADNFNIQFGVKNSILTISSVRLIKKDDYIVSGGGSGPFSFTKSGYEKLKNEPLNFSLGIENGRLSILKGLSYKIKEADGNLDFNVSLSGTINNPVLSGILSISDGKVALSEYVKEFKDVNVECTLSNNEVLVKNFSAKAGEAKLRIDGKMLLKDLLPNSFNFVVYTEGKKGLPVSIPQLPIPTPLIKKDGWNVLSSLSKGEPRFKVSFSGTLEAQELSGWVELENTNFTYPSILKNTGGRSDDLDLIKNLTWNLDLKAGKNTWYENEFVTVNAKGALHLSGKDAKPVTNGTLEAIRGEIVYLGNEFKIRRARLVVVNDKVFLEGDADTEITLPSTGESSVVQLFIDYNNIDSIKPRFVSVSDPTLTSEKALALATGVDPDKFTIEDRDFFMRQQLLRIFDSTLATPLAKKLLRKTGLVDSFSAKYDPTKKQTQIQTPGNPSIPELLSGTKYSLEKYLSDKVLLGYSVTFDQAQSKLDLRHELDFSYQWVNNIFIKGVYELGNNNQLSPKDKRITVEQQWRFGWPKKKSN